MIRPLEKKTIETGGATLDEAKYHIDPSALPNITSILRGLYSDPLKAVIREYVTNAVDAHVEAGIPDVAIDIHLPTRMEPTFTVRDYGLGLDVEHTKKLLYGYGASGDLKRESNTQIGGFGIGCKCAFSVAESFTYTIWHGGRKRIWSCFLDESDTGLSKLLYDEEDNGPAGVEVSIVVKMDYDSENRIQRAVNELLMFLPGEFKLADSCAARYSLPKQPKPLIEQEVESTVNGRVSKLTFQFFNPHDISDMPMIIVGGTSYKIADEHLSEALKVPDLDNKRAERMRVLANQMAVQCPVGYLQIAPSREELQYSGLTKKVLRGIFSTISSESFMDELHKKIKAKCNGATLLERRRQSVMLGMKIKEDQSDEDGLWISSDMAEGMRGIAVYGLRWGSGYAQRYSEATLWPKMDKVSVFNAGLVDDTNRNTVHGVVAVTNMPSEDACRKTASQIASKLMAEGGKDSGLDVVYIMFLVKPKLDEIKWLKDGSIKVFSTDDLPEINPAYFRSVSATGSKPVKSHTKRTGLSLGTKFLKLGAACRSGVSGDGAWWNPAPMKTLSSGVYVTLDKYRVVLSKAPQRTCPDYAAGFLKDLTKTKAVEVLPALADGLLGVKSANITPELKASTDFMLLWTYIHNRFKEDVGSGKLDTEALLTLVALSDCDSSYCRVNKNSTWPKALGELAKMQELSKLPAVAAMKKWKTLIDVAMDQSTVTGKWFSVIYAAEDNMLPSGAIDSNSWFRLAGKLMTCLDSGVRMFDMSQGRGPLTAWWNAWSEAAEGTGWLRYANMAGLEMPGKPPLTLNPLEVDVAELCRKLPLMTEALEVKSSWLGARPLSWYEAKRDAAKEKPFLMAPIEKQIMELLANDAEFRKYLAKSAR